MGELSSEGGQGELSHALEMPIPASFGAIRPWNRTDAGALVKYANNRKIWLNMRDAFPHPYTEASAQWFLDLVERQNPTT